MNDASSSFVRIPWFIIGLVVALCVISVLNLHSTSLGATSDVHLRQLGWMVLGFVVMLTVAVLDERLVQEGVWFFYGAVVILLALVLVFGVKVNGATRWLDLGVTRFQPSELAKVAVILALASWFQHAGRPDGYSLRDLVPVAAILGVPMFLILREPDLGHTLMLLFIGGTMVSFEKLERRALIILSVSTVLLAPVIWTTVLRDYQKDRVLTLLDKNTDALGTGWHARQAQVAVGSGGMFGKGHGEGTQVAGGFLPENHNDFVFAHLAEEQGFVGASAVLLLYFLLIIAALQCAGRAKDRFGAGVAVGVAALIFWHVIMNVGMVLNVLPVTGVTLPLLSYGGTSALTVMFAIGLLLNIDKRRSMFRTQID